MSKSNVVSIAGEIHTEQEKMEKINNLMTVLNERLEQYSGSPRERHAILEEISKIQSQLNYLQHHLLASEKKNAA